MARQSNHRQLNTAGLEADVMRFMAIIAFCLIAIMALVKDIEPQAAFEPQARLEPQATLAPALIKTVQEIQLLPKQKIESISATNLVSDKMDRLTIDEDFLPAVPINELLNDILATSYSPVEIKPSNSHPVDLPKQDNSTQEIAATDSTETISERLGTYNMPEEDTSDISHPLAKIESAIAIQSPLNEKNMEPVKETLTFRFDSDATFIHLIATNNLKLFASTSHGFLEMDQAFNVISSKPTGELFEIMRQSIPTKISSQFEKEFQSPVYLVALSSTTRNDLDTFLASPGLENKTGVLVIHQDGRISHES